MAQHETTLAEVTLNISTRSVTQISSKATVESEELQGDVWRSIGVAFISDAFKTNSREKVVELSDIVERTREAMRVAPDAPFLGLYNTSQPVIKPAPYYRERTMMSMRPEAPSILSARFLNGGMVNDSCVVERFTARGTTYG